MKDTLTLIICGLSAVILLIFIVKRNRADKKEFMKGLNSEQDKPHAPRMKDDNL